MNNHQIFSTFFMNLSWQRLTFLIFLIVASNPLSYAQTDHFAYNGSFCTFTHIIRPAARHYNGKTYIAYQGTNFNSYLAYYDHQKGQWSDIVLLGTSIDIFDGHGSPSLLIDDRGFFHVFFAGHNYTPHKYIRSKGPESIGSWEQMPVIFDKSSYPQAIQLENGSIFVFFRHGVHYDDWAYKVSNDHGDNWSGNIPVLEGHNPELGWYAMFLEGSKSETIHCAFVWLIEDGPLRGGRYHTYYMFRDNDGIWKNIHGTELDIPLSKIDADNLTKIYDSGDKMTQVPWLCLDRDNNPNMLFTTGGYIGSTDYTYKFIKWMGTNWEVYDLGATTDNSCDYYSLDLISTDTLDAYLTTDLTPGSGNNFIDRGGNIEKWSSFNGGVNWQKTQTIMANGIVHNDPRPVLDYHQEGKIIFSEQPDQETYENQFDEFNYKVYLYGDSGFVKRNIGTSIRVFDTIRPLDIILEQNYPNPFNMNTNIRFRTYYYSKTSLKIYSTSGRLIKILFDSELPDGNHIVTWDGTNERNIAVSSGVYIYRLQSGIHSYSKKMVLLK